MALCSISLGHASCRQKTSSSSASEIDGVFEAKVKVAAMR
jgi:hypothetical protein